MDNYMTLFQGKIILITGGTGSLGKALIRRLFYGKNGIPSKIVVFSRDEAKQHALRMKYENQNLSSDESISHDVSKKLEFVIGDIRDYKSIAAALRGVDIVFNAAALKQVPTCEYFPIEAVKTNIEGAENIVRAIQEQNIKVETVVGISTDKAVKPVNVMGMTKAIQERIFARANCFIENTRFIIVRYGNVLASRGSVIPLFHSQIHSTGRITITDNRMTRFLMSLDDAVNVIFTAVKEAHRGETYIPRVLSGRITDIAKALTSDLDVKISFIGIRSGEKLHEVLISEEEGYRSFIRGKYYVVSSVLPELVTKNNDGNFINKEYCSSDYLMPLNDVKALLIKNNLMIKNTCEKSTVDFESEILS
jgi:UDP-glucose 4-epimerase